MWKYKTVEVVDHAATGAEFRRLRVEAGFSAVQVAARCGICSQTLSKLENGHRSWTQDYVDDLNESLQELIANHTPLFPSRSQIEEMARMRREGCSCQQIAKAVGMGCKRVQRIICENRYPDWTDGPLPNWEELTCSLS